ncbi:hypothetical protein ACFQL7_04590 [Halocatena marina]|uniref:Uncharacterized protein n=1 Tax=Halocatena marina TaxID=2934937 RepID=A0ABD5YN55_9EURY
MVGYTIPVSAGEPPFLAVLAAIAIVVGVAMVHAYRNDGLLVTTLLTVAVRVAGIPGLHLEDSLGPVLAVTLVESLALIVWFAGLGIGAFVVGVVDVLYFILCEITIIEKKSPTQ